MPPSYPNHNLLHQEIITVKHGAHSCKKSLPEVYAALATDSVDDFTFLRPHQRHFWHATLCQLGALAMVNAGLTLPPQTPSEWTRLLQNLTAEEFPEEEPWRLVTADISKPAFLQPPASEEKREKDYKTRLYTPAQMDLLVGSKHHDVRDTDILNPNPEHWLFALVALQTGGGFDGNRLYGISRMNKGHGNRHGFSLTPSTRWGPHATRDMQILAQTHQGQPVKGLLLWTEPWDGTEQEQIKLHSLKPQALYLEICRRIRLGHGENGRISGCYATSEKPRIDAKDANGITQDPWTVTETDKAVTVGPGGFGYRQTVQYLNPGKCAIPLLAKPSPSVDGNTEMFLVARALARGQGGTEGYHERTIPLTAKTAEMIRNPETQTALYTAAKFRVDCIAEVQSILGHAVKSYLQNDQGNGATRNEHQGTITKARHRLEQHADRNFWGDLQEETGSGNPEEIRQHWIRQRLVPQAREILDSVCKSGLGRHADRYEATTQAKDLFHRRIANSKKLQAKPDENTEEEEQI